MRFCQALMTELWRHLGPDTDVPAGISAWGPAKWALWPG
jgi:glutamate dehydrogenase/leucine dehydrogenase